MKIVNVMSGKMLGGVEQAFINYNNALSLSGHQVFAIFNKNGKVKDKIEKIDNVEYLPSIFFKPYFLLFPYFYFKIKKIKPDVILIQSRKILSLFAKIGKLLNISVVAMTHGDKVKYFDKADYIISTTQHQKDNLVENGFNEKNIFVIPNLINEKVEYKEFVNFSNPPVFGVMSRFEPAKGLGVLVEACKILKEKDADFKVKIGGSPEQKYLNEYCNILKLIERYGLEKNIEFLGWVDDKKDFYGNIDVFLLSSIHEAFGIVLLEAMMYSKPIISSLAEGPAEIFKDGKNDFTFAVGDYEKLAELMIKILNSKDFAKQIVKDNYELVNEKYTINCISKKINDILLRIKNSEVNNLN